VAYFDRLILPGGEGRITLKLDTSGYEGLLRKSARVYTNDPIKPVDTIYFSGHVKVPIHVSSRLVYLQGKTAQTVTKTIQISAELDKPLKIQPIGFNLNNKLTYRIEELKAGKVYEVHFTSLPSAGNFYQGILRLRTNYPEKPEIDIWIRGRFLN
jgi:hypothetical protein